jgi:hypothetical protein
MMNLTAPIEYEGRTYHVTYDPQAFQDPELRALVDQMKGAGWLALSLSDRALARVVVSWDLLDLDGNPIPPTEQGMNDHLLPDQSAAIIKGLIDHANRFTAGARRFTPSAKASQRKRERR